MDVQRISSESPWEDRIGFSRAVRVGGVVLVSGTTAITRDGAIAGGGDAYLQACAALDIDPGRTVAIEDSPTGVRAAVAAGVPTVGVPLMVSLEGAGADALWPTLEDRTPSDIAAFWSAHAASRH